MGKRAVVLRHLPFESLGIIKPLLQQRGYQVQIVEVGIQPIDDALLDAELMIVLGGPIGVHEFERYPFLVEELALVKHRLMTKKPMLGICLGAQLIAQALDAKVFAMRQAEIGFYYLNLTDAGRCSPLRHLQNNVMVLHWHGDQFAVPAQASLLASSQRCANQAFAIGNNVLALQFHIEVETDHIEQWLIGHTVELNQHGIDLKQMRERAKLFGPVLKRQGEKVINDWLDHLNYENNDAVSMATVF